jgi:hypothetical protein
MGKIPSEAEVKAKRALFNKRVAKARKDVAAMDKHDGYKERELRTIFLALQCGLQEENLSAAFDALVMLEDVQPLKIRAD